MIKIIEIEICSSPIDSLKSCPYFEEGDEYHMCQLFPRGRWNNIFDYGLPIPSWCPLPDKEVKEANNG